MLSFLLCTIIFIQNYLLLNYSYYIVRGVVKLTKSNNQRGIQSLQLGINILDVFLEERKPLKFVEIQEATGMTKSNLYKYLYTLIQSGLLYNDPEDRTYMLGSRLIEYGHIASEYLDILPMVESALEKIGEETSLTSLFAVWQNGVPVIAHIHSADYGVNIGAQMGHSLPLMSSTGKIFSVFKKGREKDNWELQELSKLSNEEKEKFITECEKIKEVKFTHSVEPLIKHVSSFSVPVLDFKKDLAGAITVVGFDPLVPRKSDDHISKYVLSVASKISKKLGYEGEY